MHLILIVAAVLIVAIVILGFLRVLGGVACFALALVVAVVAALAFIKVSQFKAMGAVKWSLPPTPVTTAATTAETWNPMLDAVGTLSAVEGVTVTAQLDGNVTKIAFDAGGEVKAGDLLVQQDISAEKAQLQAAQAAETLAKLNLRRSRDLLAKQAISRQQLDSDEATYKQAVADAANDQAAIDKKTIRAPFSGRLGIRQVNLGQTLKAGDPIVTLEELRPIYADFSLPQQDLARIADGMTVRLTTDAGGAPEEGKITAIEPDVDTATRNVKVEATLGNSRERLRPGMFADVEVILPVKSQVLVIPATSVLSAPYGDSVFIVEDGKDMAGKPAKVVRQQFVRLGERRGDFVAVVSGLKEGEVVVTTGAFKLRNGMSVTIDNSLAPHAELAPTPGGFLMKITDLFIRRPVLALVVSFVILIAGLQAIHSLNIRQYPQSQNASITVTTVYVGASPDLVRGFVTTPLEQSIAAADGIDYLQSQSSQGQSLITARLKLNYDPTKALADISARVDQVRNLLPPEAQIPAIAIVPADSQFASAYLSFSSKVLQHNEITDYLVRAVQPRLAALEGVQSAQILGGRTFAMRIWLRADKMAALGVSPSEVTTALAAQNHLSALGTTKGSLIQINLTADTDLHTVDEFKQLVIRQQNGAIIRLKDVADVVLGAEDYDSEVRFSGETAVFIGVYVLPSANSLDVIKRVRTEMDSIEHDLPSGLQARVAYDATEYIQAAIHDVFHTLVITLLIVVVVIFLFLGSVRSVLIPIVAIPISLIGGVFLMQAFGFTVNLLTLLAIVLSVGLVVDDAIVVVENVERHLSLGSPPLQAALIGARELVGPIIAMTITLATVYVPIGLQGGVTGSLFREFAFTLAGTVAISGVVALTLSPMMAGALLRPGQEEHGFAGVLARGFDRLRRAYGRALEKTLRNRGAIYAVWIILGVLGLGMLMMSPTELAPAEDQGVVFGIMTASANATLDQTDVFAQAAGRIFRSEPESDFTFQLTFPDHGFGGLVVKPWNQRKRSVYQILPEVQAKLNAVPGIQMFCALPPALPAGDNFPMEFVISTTNDYDQLLPLAQKIADDAAKTGMFAFPPQLDVKVDQPQAELVIDRNKAAALGLSLQQIGTDLAAAVGGNYVNFFDIAGRSYKVIPQLKRVDRLNPGQLRDLYVKGPGGQLISVATFATIRDSTVARSLNRFQQLNSVLIQGLSFRPLDQALSFLEADAAKTLPKGYVIDYMGESRQLRREGGSAQFYQMMGLAAILIFLVLAAQFNSFRDPLIILGGSVPLALFGASLFMFLRMPNPNIPSWTNGWTTTLNIYSKVGLVTLIGLIAKNGILIVEFANKLQLEGRAKIEAVHEAAMTRLRPVLMTTVATVAGHFPLTIVTGPGAAARNSIGRVLVGGMSIGTVFTLFIVPCVYVLLAKDHAKDRAREQAVQAAGTEGIRPAHP